MSLFFIRARYVFHVHCLSWVILQTVAFGLFPQSLCTYMKLEMFDFVPRFLQFVINFFMFAVWFAHRILLFVRAKLWQIGCLIHTQKTRMKR